MSHYVVLVIGDDVEGQLAPFDENTVMERYVRYTWDQLVATERANIKRYLKGTYTDYMRDPGKYIADCMERFEGKNPEENTHLEYLRFAYPLKWHWTDEQCHAEQLKYEEDENVTPDGGVWSTYNPKSQWDWYQVGGRWPGKLLLKTGVSITGIKPPNFAWGYDEGEGLEIKKKILSEPRTDSALKSQCDWAKMHQDPEEYAKHIRYWDLRVNGAEPVTEKEREEVKHDYYRDEYYTDRYKNAETYAKCCSNFTAWGYVKDGVWCEKGKMGWWGVSDESDEAAVRWDLGFYDNVIKPLHPITRITVVDCHI